MYGGVFDLCRNVNIMDNMLRMMEKYADNLEELVEEKTYQYMEEKKKADLLLYSMMPKLVLYDDLVLVQEQETTIRYFTPLVFNVLLKSEILCNFSQTDQETGR